MAGTVLVTGATGFVGSHLVRRLVNDGAEVHALCRAASNFWRLQDVLPKIRTHLADVIDAPALTALLRRLRPEYVFHLASATVVAGAEAGSADLVGTNLAGTINLIDACIGSDLRGFVSTGDSFEYSPSSTPLSENDACKPASLHGITKLAATLYARARAEAHDQPIVTLRLFSTYGPADNPRRLVPRVIAGALNGMPILMSRPQIARDWIYVDDVVSLYLEAAVRARQLKGRAFNVGSGQRADLQEIVSTILAITSSETEVRWGAFPAPKHDDHPWIADMRQTFAAFDWRPRTSLHEGLCRTIWPPIHFAGHFGPTLLPR
jgi:nucleoside-diphosphate-sugar epimerase